MFWVQGSEMVISRWGYFYRVVISWSFSWVWSELFIINLLTMSSMVVISGFVPSLGLCWGVAKPVSIFLNMTSSGPLLLRWPYSANRSHDQYPKVRYYYVLKMHVTYLNNSKQVEAGQGILYGVRTKDSVLAFSVSVLSLTLYHTKIRQNDSIKPINCIKLRLYTITAFPTNDF